MPDSPTVEPCSIMIIAGEVSGDVHGSALVRHIKGMCPGAQFFGIGGPRMARQGVELLHSIDQMAFLGFAEVLRHLPFVRRVLNEMRRILAERKPDLLILIDYPGFNLKLAKLAHARNVPVMYYISPQVWAWGRSRISKIRRWVTRMVVVLPFEQQMYARYGVSATFVGHPLLDIVAPTMDSDAFRGGLGIGPEERLVGLLPGSRQQEVAKLLPVMVEAGTRVQQQVGKVRLAVGAAETLDDGVYHRALGQRRAPIPLVREMTYDLMKHADLLLVASGTATLESAILATPMVVLYKVAPVSYAIARVLLRIPCIGLVNVVAGKKIVPEFVQGKAHPERIAQAGLEILQDADCAARMRADLSEIRSLLGQPGASQRAARIATGMIDEAGP